MPKAVLVMDMPERCDKCLLLLKIPQKNGLALCLARKATEQEKYNPKYERSWRPDWCPLRELPEKLHNDNGCDEYSDGYDYGFNACLKKIAGDA